MSKVSVLVVDDAFSSTLARTQAVDKLRVVHPPTASKTPYSTLTQAVMPATAHY